MGSTRGARCPESQQLCASAKQKKQGSEENSLPGLYDSMNRSDVRAAAQC